MRRIQVNAIVDVIALLVFIPSLISGMVLYLVLPSGTRGGAAFLGITRNQWLNMHDFTSIAFAVLILLHIALHWKFYRNILQCFRAKEKCADDK